MKPPPRFSFDDQQGVQHSVSRLAMKRQSGKQQRRPKGFVGQFQVLRRFDPFQLHGLRPLLHGGRQCHLRMFPGEPATNVIRPGGSGRNFSRGNFQIHVDHIIAASDAGDLPIRCGNLAGRLIQQISQSFNLSNQGPFAEHPGFPHPHCRIPGPERFLFLALTQRDRFLHGKPQCDLLADPIRAAAIGHNLGNSPGHVADLNPKLIGAEEEIFGHRGFPRRRVVGAPFRTGKPEKAARGQLDLRQDAVVVDLPSHHGGIHGGDAVARPFDDDAPGERQRIEDQHSLSREAAGGHHSRQ